MKEVVFDYEEFKQKVDLAKPLHHYGCKRRIDKYGAVVKLETWIEGVSKAGHIIAFYMEKYAEAYGDESKNMYHQFAEKYAKPLGSTEGMWKP